MKSLEVNYATAAILLSKLQPPLEMFENAMDREILDPKDYEDQEVLLPTGAKLVCTSTTKRRKKTYRYTVHGYAYDGRDITDLGLTLKEGA